MRVLFLTHRLPYAPNRGDRIRAFHMLRQLRGTADVDLVSLVHDREEEAQTGALSDLCDSVAVARLDSWRYAGVPAHLMSSRPLTHQLLRSGQMQHAIAQVVEARRPDVVLAYCSGVAEYALRPPLNRLPLVLDMVDVDSEKWRELATQGHGPRQWVYAREARTLRGFEACLARRATSTLVVNEREREVLHRIAPGAAIEVVPNGVDVAAYRPTGPPTASNRVIFSGVFSYAPNAEGARWLAREVWPHVRAARPDAELWLVGSQPTSMVRALACEAAGIHVTGSVPDVRPYLWESAVAAAPLAVARGLQNKVLEALAAGLPCVVTPAVYDGLPQEVKSDVSRCSAAPEFASAIVRSLDLPIAERRRHLSTIQLSELTWERRLGGLAPLLAAAAQAPVR